ncbi:hypothetical protein [Kitasatospora sp. NPDC002965]|uniref:hypothetical protein n=1 Tax=Kitasatospora sp. NPDC002965 TaxID=3154775 RepID=UPI0033BF7C4E
MQCRRGVWACSGTCGPKPRRARRHSSRCAATASTTARSSRPPGLGEHLDPTTWTAAARAQRALLTVAASTWLVSAVDKPDHQALSAGFWTLAQGMTCGNTAAMDSYAAALEVYTHDIEAANAFGAI